MTDPLAPVPTPPKAGKIETKTKAAATAAYVSAFLLLAVISSVDTDMVNALPDQFEVPVYALLPAVTALLAGYVRKHKPNALSRSAVEAVTQRALRAKR